MADKCEVFFEKSEYSPGETLTGRVESNFSSETKVKGIHIKITGEAKVYWKAGTYTYRRAQEIYFEMDADLLSGEVAFPTGQYVHPFSFTLPADLPPSMSEGDPSYSRIVASFLVPLNLVTAYYGCVEYTIQALVNRSWSLNLETKKTLKISSSYDLNTIPGIEKPFDIVIAKRPTSVTLQSTGPIMISVESPQGGYVPSQTMRAIVKVKNESAVDIQYIQFKFVQGFIFQADQYSKNIDAFSGDYFVLKESGITSGSEKFWTLDLKVPLMLLGNFKRCNVIKIFWELRGEVCLPFPSSAIVIHVPITLGSIPLEGTTK